MEIAVRWAEDPEPAERRPAVGGWSMGELRLTVNHHVLSRNEYAGASSEGVKWYLLPVFEWIADKWVHLLHEERFAWRENSSAPAATATLLALRRLIDADYGLLTGESYSSARAWWSRHSLRSADSSALYPDVFFRRLRDEIEISWTSRQPEYAPDGFRFELMPGVAMLPVAQVAGPLWEMLNWVGVNAGERKLADEDRQSIARLEERLSELKRLSAFSLEAAYLPARLFSELSTLRKRAHLPDESIRLKYAPALAILDEAVLMFGGVSPDIGRADMETLLGLLSSKAGGSESPAFQELVDDTVGAPTGVPYEEGYEAAEQLLEEYALPGDSDFIDIRALLAKWNVEIVERMLRTSTIRGIAIAGSGYAPTILVNNTSDYNANEAGKRFTLAHELFHLLYDRGFARRVTHVSGSWAPPSVEKRANAFAAMLLMPRSLVRRSLGAGMVDANTVASAAGTLQVGISALVEHLYNISMIDETTRDSLRQAVTKTV